MNVGRVQRSGSRQARRRVGVLHMGGGGLHVAVERAGT